MTTIPRYCGILRTYGIQMAYGLLLQDPGDLPLEADQRVLVVEKNSDDWSVPFICFSMFANEAAGI